MQTFSVARKVQIYCFFCCFFTVSVLVVPVLTQLLCNCFAERQLWQHGGVDCPHRWTIAEHLGMQMISEDLVKRVFPAGVLDLLQKPVVAFVRLSDSVVMESVLETHVPVRFVFVLVGPSQSGMDYSETGRAMGALMADWVRQQSGNDGTAASSVELVMKTVYRRPPPAGLLSGSVPGPDRQRCDQRHCRLHGLQHHHSSNWDPGNIHAGAHNWFPEEDAAWPTPSRRCPARLWRQGQRSAPSRIAVLVRFNFLLYWSRFFKLCICLQANIP